VRIRPDETATNREMRMSAKPMASVQPAALGRRDVFRLALTAGVVASAAIAAPAWGADVAADTVQRLGTSLARLTQNGGTPFTQRFAQFAPVVDQTFDLQSILRASVGLGWDAMTQAEQADLIGVFRQYTVASFVANFDKPKGDFQIGTLRAAPSGEKVVDTRMGETKLSYVLRETPGGWRVVDVLADGTISRVATQRSDFRSTLMHGGGRALAAILQRKISDLSGGSLA
jgi:phospholipid transport system substrate-binding protein